MATEIEAKYRLDNPAALRQVAANAGATHKGMVLETNRFFDWPDGSLRAGDRGLRVRLAQPIVPAEPWTPVGEPKVIVTYKGPREPGPMKVREEFEFGADSVDGVAAVLEGMGMSQTFLFQKRRDRWILGECELALDETPWLGHFLEIEGPSGPAVAAAAEVLGMADAPMVSETYTKLLRQYAKRHGHDTHTITF